MRLAIKRRTDEVSEHIRSRRAVERDAVGRVAQPDAHGKLGRDTAERDVFVIAARACLTGGRTTVGKRCRSSGTAGDDALHDFSGRMSDFSRDHPLAFRMGVVKDHVAFAVRHLQDGLRFVVHAAVRDVGIGIRHIEHRDVVRAECERGICFGKRGADAHAFRHFVHFVGTHRHLESHETGVRRHGKRACDAARAVTVIAGIVQGLSISFDFGGRRTVDRRLVRIHACLERCDKRERLEGRAAGATRIGRIRAGTRRQVDLARTVILTAHHGLDMAGGRIDGHDRGFSLIGQRG